VNVLFSALFLTCWFIPSVDTANVGIAGIAILVALALNQQLAVPVAKLTGAVTRLAAGDLTARINLSFSRGELGQLADLFNGIAAEIEQRDIQLRKSEKIHTI
jgi:methyl-accepting chemotaxis protein